MNQNANTKKLIKSWNRLPFLFRVLSTGFLVSTIGVSVWSAMLITIPAPWSVLPMTIALWLFWKYFSGSWGSKESVGIRKENFRKTRLDPGVWKWGLAGAVCFVAVIQASFVINFRIIEFPKAQFTADYKLLDTMPLWVAWPILTMSAIVAGICEETGYRGYLQAPLEKKYGPFTAIVISSLVFTSIHLTKNWAYPIMPHIFFASILLGILAYKSNSLIPGIIGHSILDIFNYSVWWTSLTGGFRKQTIFKTGIDAHFILWVLIFILSLFIFFKAISRLKRDPLK